uniref:Crossover junction endonuclease MUS81 n=1 Tax=Macrostomum lignano TaxID=282301 RepID=A0A1I8J7L5_9PLAT
MGSVKQMLLPGLLRNNVKCDVRPLQVSDFLWVAKCRSTGREAVLNLLVERKRLDDLASSIKDGRFKEQKFRLRRSGIAQLLLLVEGFGGRSGGHVRMPEETLAQAVCNSQLIDGCAVKYTDSAQHTVSYLTLLTCHLRDLYSGRQLLVYDSMPATGGVSKDSRPTVSAVLPLGGPGTDANAVDFAEFNRAAIKSKKLVVREMLAKHLLQIGGVTMEKALAIVQQYPTVQALLDAYAACETDAERRRLLSGICHDRIFDKRIGTMLLNLHAVQNPSSELPLASPRMPVGKRRVEWGRAMRQRSYQLASESHRQSRRTGEQLRRRLVSEAVATDAELERLRRQRAGMEARLDRYTSEQARHRSQRLLHDMEQQPVEVAEISSDGNNTGDDLPTVNEFSDLTDWEAARLAEFVARQREQLDGSNGGGGGAEEVQIDGLSLEKFLRSCEARRSRDGAIRRLCEFVDSWRPALGADATAAWRFRRQRRTPKVTDEAAAAAAAAPAKANRVRRGEVIDDGAPEVEIIRGHQAADDLDWLGRARFGCGSKVHLSRDSQRSVGAARDVALSGGASATGEAMDPPGGAGDHEANLHLAPAVPGGRLRLGTMNFRTLKAPWRRTILVQLAHDLQLDFVSLQEVSIVAELGLHSEDFGDGWSLLYTSADDRGRGGVGVLIGPRLQQSVHCISLSPRLMRVDLRLRARCIRLCCAYAPTAAHPEEARTTRKEDHRGISLMSCTAKLFNRLLLDRLQLRAVLDPYLRYEQNGFRPQRGTLTQILALRRVIEEARIRQSTLIIVFVDFRKAFDSVLRAALPFVLRAYRVPQQLIDAVMALYCDTGAAVVTADGLSDLFDTSSRVLQGDTLAPFLFVLLLDWVLRTALPSADDGFLLRRRIGRRHGEKRLIMHAARGELFLKRLLPLSDVIAFAFAAYQLFYELQLFGHLG